jgi:hypothetical protein
MSWRDIYAPWSWNSFGLLVAMTGVKVHHLRRRNKPSAPGTLARVRLARSLIKPSIRQIMIGSGAATEDND